MAIDDFDYRMRPCRRSFEVVYWPFGVCVPIRHKCGGQQQWRRKGTKPWVCMLCNQAQDFVRVPIARPW